MNSCTGAFSTFSDYPEHLVQASLLWHPFQPLELGTEQTFRWQTGNRARTGSDFGADGSFVVRFTPPKADYATLSLFVNNAWNDDFQPFPGQRPMKRLAGVSLTLDWKTSRLLRFQTSERRVRICSPRRPVTRSKRLQDNRGGWYRAGV
jgi:hypothetical protein